MINLIKCWLFNKHEQEKIVYIDRPGMIGLIFGIRSKTVVIGRYCKHCRRSLNNVGKRLTNKD